MNGELSVYKWTQGTEGKHKYDVDAEKTKPLIFIKAVQFSSVLAETLMKYMKISWEKTFIFNKGRQSVRLLWIICRFVMVTNLHLFYTSCIFFYFLHQSIPICIVYQLCYYDFDKCLPLAHDIFHVMHF